MKHLSYIFICLFMTCFAWQSPAQEVIFSKSQKSTQDTVAGKSKALEIKKIDSKSLDPSRLMVKKDTNLQAKSDTLIPYQVGKPTKEELLMKRYTKDTGAVALKMIDFGKAKLGNISTLNIYQKYKIFKKQGYSHATLKIPFYAPSKDNLFSNDYISILYGHVYNLEGDSIRVDTLKKADMYVEDLEDGWKQMRFTLPNVKEGCIFEVEYTHSSQYGRSFLNWYFQDIIPVAWSEYQLSYRYGLAEFKVLTEVNNPFIIREDYSEQAFFSTNEVHRWAMKNVPAIQEEPYIASLKNYIDKIEFELSAMNIDGKKVFKSETWEDVIKKLQKDDDFGKDIKSFGKLKDAVKAILEIETDTLRQVEKAYQHIKRHFHWSGKEALYTSGNLKNSYEKGLGNSADINLTLVAMLRRMDFEANPVILCTRRNGRIYDTPFLRKINYVVAHVNIKGKDYLLDATEPFGRFGVLPIRCLNGRGYLINDKNSHWIDLTTPDAMRNYTKVDTQVDEVEGVHKGEIVFSGSGYYAESMREAIKSETPAKFKESFAKAHTELQSPQVELHNIEADSSDSPEIRCKAITSEGIQVAVNRIYLSMFITEGLKENPFYAEKRTFPIDFSVPIEDFYLANYTLPPGYEIEEMPKSINISGLNGSLRYILAIKKNDNVLAVSSRLVIKKPVFSVEEYPALRDFYNKVVAKQAEKVVLRKGN